MKVGCCGFPGGMKNYYRDFDLVEVQKTFYKPPRIETLKRWREAAPKGFEFSVKAWQLITHDPRSPTYRKAGIKLEEGSYDRYGFFRPTEEVFEAWAVVKECCKVLRSKICIFQTPASFRKNKENLENIKNFFGSINRNDIKLGLELRSKSWDDETLSRMLEEFGLIHVVDPFDRLPLHKGRMVYFRLHGSPPGTKMYRYKYEEEDLRYLISVLEKFSHCEMAYVLFNNVYMREDALRFIEMLIQERQGDCL
ncbi:MAG: DUF72 domain-containing protein [Candidatus Asgardarchaeia archaeon]